MLIPSTPTGAADYAILNRASVAAYPHIHAGVAVSPADRRRAPAVERNIPGRRVGVVD